MFTTIATLEYLSNGCSNDFCTLSVMGMDDDMVAHMTESWERAKSERKRDSDEKIRTNKTRIESLEKEIIALAYDYSKSRKWYRFRTIAEKQMLLDIEKKRIEVANLELDIQRVSKRTDYSAKVLKNKAHELLLKNGFVLISKSSTNHTVEVWHKFS